MPFTRIINCKDKELNAKRTKNLSKKSNKKKRRKDRGKWEELVKKDKKQKSEDKRKKGKVREGRTQGDQPCPQ